MSSSSSSSCSASTPSASAVDAMTTVHEFAVPIQAKEILDRIKQKDQAPGRGAKRAKRWKGRGAADAAEVDPIIHRHIPNPPGWCALPLADVLFQIATGDPQLQSESWACEVKQ